MKLLHQHFAHRARYRFKTRLGKTWGMGRKLSIANFGNLLDQSAAAQRILVRGHTEKHKGLKTGHKQTHVGMALHRHTTGTYIPHCDPTQLRA